jgi:hypothetical protein
MSLLFKKKENPEEVQKREEEVQKLLKIFNNCTYNDMAKINAFTKKMLNKFAIVESETTEHVSLSIVQQYKEIIDDEKTISCMVFNTDNIDSSMRFEPVAVLKFEDLNKERSLQTSSLVTTSTATSISYF